MKGILNFLEKAGLVKHDDPLVMNTTDAAPVASFDATTADVPVSVIAPAARVVAHGPSGSVHAVNTSIQGAALQLDDIYVGQGVAASIYPAERLLRLVDGLRAMDEATRQMAIKAMDAADESWTIQDPLADAVAKVQALSAHAERLQLNLQHLEGETQARIEAVNARQAQVVGGIQKQISELEALVARETARSSQETTAHEADLKAAREQTASELATISQVSGQLQGLSVQFGPPITQPKE